MGLGGLEYIILRKGLEFALALSARTQPHNIRTTKSVSEPVKILSFEIEKAALENTHLRKGFQTKGFNQVPQRSKSACNLPCKNRPLGCNSSLKISMVKELLMFRK